MKKVVLCLCVMVLSATAFSQVTGVGSELAMGIDVAAPVGSFGTIVNPGIGFDISVGYNFTQNWAVLLNGGYLPFFTTQKYRDRGRKTLDDGFIKLNGRYSTNKRIYFEPGIGFSKFSSGNSVDIGGDGVTLAAAVGYYVNATRTFDFNLRFESTSNGEKVQFIGLGIGYRFISIHPL